MKKGFVIIAVLLSVLFYGYALAVDDTDIQELQTNVSSTKSKADKNSADIQNLKEGLPAIEERVSTIEDSLAGICESCGSSAPPVIVHDAPDSSSNFEEEIIFTLSDDVELSHFILQGDASPHIQLTEYFKPGVDNVTITHTFGVPIELLAIVVDTDGNATKNLIVIEFDAPPPCTTGETITCGECESGTSTCSGGLWGLCIGEVSTDSDPDNCGSCGNACDAEQICIDGQCQSSM